LSSLTQNHDPDEREYPDPKDQIREVLIHGNYLSQRDIEICLGYDLTPLRTDPDFSAIDALHKSLRDSYS
jgi:hypothetical protein